MSIQGLVFALLLLLFVLIWIVLPFQQREARASSTDPLLEKQRERLLVYYERVLRNVRDLDEDHALGKLNEDEYLSEREDWTQRGVQVLQALDTLAERELIAPTAPADREVDHAIDDAIEAAIQRYRERTNA